MVSDEIFFNTTELENLHGFAEQALAYSIPQKNQACLIVLSGDLGSGKTTFTQHVGNILGITEPIDSPTYVIEQRYPINNYEKFNTLVHIDAYRLEEQGDPQNIGLDETLADPQNLIIIEWPEKIKDFLASYKKIAITFTHKGDERLTQVKENSLEQQ